MITPCAQSFDYTVICQQPVGEDGRGTPSAHHSPAQAPRTRPWHDFGRQNDADKIQISKFIYVFKLTLALTRYMNGKIFTIVDRKNCRLCQVAETMTKPASVLKGHMGCAHVRAAHVTLQHREITNTNTWLRTDRVASVFRSSLTNLLHFMTYRGIGRRLRINFLRLLIGSRLRKL
ncbi:Protein grainyhead [Eumeta japonica]|uniref:Protein grainyhead n=1 Tax=Eumeta variegata TaxID=151549 RepID=A0A4C1VFS5_EUMVA|nr:Protein grainyhead [Eumeta japonica]